RISVGIPFTFIQVKILPCWNKEFSLNAICVKPFTSGGTRLRLTNAEAMFVAHLNGDDFAILYEISHIRPSVQEHCEHIAKSL
ncbi:hypothetical protein, partial [Staphylococcus aureus]|uniref:hypothetical protein n=1 Tax=Staphylococcus aureus TaxID=1280 RepID=UPI001C52758E